MLASHVQILPQCGKEKPNTIQSGLSINLKNLYENLLSLISFFHSTKAIAPFGDMTQSEMIVSRVSFTPEIKTFFLLSKTGCRNPFSNKDFTSTNSSNGFSYIFGSMWSSRISIYVFSLFIKPNQKLLSEILNFNTINLKMRKTVCEGGL